MINGKTTVTTKDNSAKLLAGLKRVATMEVFVGIPEEKAGRRAEGINNAQLVFIHTNGSPLKKIPKRPVIEPAIEAEDNKEAISKELKLATQAMLNSNPAEANRHLKLAGMLGQNAARAWFTDPRNNWPPNTSRTIARKGSDMPLIDTGAMRKAIVYVVKEEND